MNLDDPTLNGVSLAAGMGVEAVRAESIAGFDAALQSALQRHGPWLIEAVIE